MVPPPTYMLARTGGWSAGGLVAVAELIDQDRAQSLQRRIRSETALTEKSLQRPLVGWGKWGRFLVKNEEGRKEGIIPDGFWLAALGSHGVVGLVSVTLAILLPGLLLLRRFPARFWGCREIGPAAALAVALTLWMCDNLLNAMRNPVFLLAAGGLSGLWLLRTLSPEAQRGPGRSAVGGPFGIQAGDHIDRDPGTGLVRVRW